MRLASVSVRSATIAIISMIGIVSIVLSLLAAVYFRQSALDAQMNSLSRVLEVATRELQQQLRQHTFAIGTNLAQSPVLIRAFKQSLASGDVDELIRQLDDPFITGFVGFSDIDLARLRVYTPMLEFVGASSQGVQFIDNVLPEYLQQRMQERDRQDRLKGVDALWLSPQGPLFSAVVPLGGLRPVGYLEVVIDPVFNLPDIARITGTPVSIYLMSGEQVHAVEQGGAREYLPVEYVLHSSDGVPAFRIVGLEDVASLNADMTRTQSITISGFLLLSLGTLLFALWLFNRFMLSPLGVMVNGMRRIADGNVSMSVNRRGLTEFQMLADTFNTMADTVRMRTNDLKRLLDMDDSAIVCFDNDAELVFFNKAASSLFGYARDELGDLDMADLLIDDISALMDSSTADARREHKRRAVIACRHKDGSVFNSDAVVNVVDVMGQPGHALALNPVSANADSAGKQTDRRLEAVEHSLSGLLESACSNPSLLLNNGQQVDLAASTAVTDKTLIREQAVRVMNLALACWEHDLGKSKIELAEDSGIWPVYIDKSTPTTRTLDKYLNLEICPKNPRSQRVVDTAEYVLRRVDNNSTPACQKLQQALDAFRERIAGVKKK